MKLMSVVDGKKKYLEEVNDEAFSQKIALIYTKRDGKIINHLFTSLISYNLINCPAILLSL